MRYRGQIGAALVLALVAGPGAAVGHASSAARVGSASGSTLYVNGSNSSACSDQGSGTSAVPFCTVQQAFDVVTAGQTVDIESNSGIAGTPLTLSASGTATAPITVDFTNNTLVLLSADQGPAITLSGANYVELDNFSFTDPSTTAPAVAVQNSSHVTLNRGQVMGDGTGVELSGASGADTVERTWLEVHGTGVAVDSGVSNAVVTTDEFLGFANTSVGVAVTGATGTDVVSNTMSPECVAGVSVSAAAHTTVIENNVIGLYSGDSTFCSSTMSTALGIDVAADSASGTVEKYDTFDAYQNSPVSWAGASYTSLAAYQAASGQGAHDLFTIGSAESRAATAEYVDSADALAPGELSTDLAGGGRVDDPQVADTGTGAGYYDRGSEELEDAFSVDFLNAGAHPTTARGAEVVYDVTACYSWGSTYTVTVTWGDGQSSSASNTAASTCGGQGATFEHTYAKPGTYPITLTGTDGYTTLTHTASIGTNGLDYTAAGPIRILDTRSGLGVPKGKVAQNGYAKVKVAGNGSIPADARAVAINLTVTNTTGGGLLAAMPTNANYPTVPLPTLYYTAGQTVANSAIVPVGADGDIEVYNYSGTSSVDVIVDVTGYFTRTAAAGYAPATLDRILDTRKGLGAPKAQLAGDHSLTLGITGTDSIPATATAVAVHLTAVNGTGAGNIAATPDGSGTPTTSSVNYAKSQAVSNTVIVPIAPDGKIQLYNNSASSVDVLADVSGYFAASVANTYLPAAPVRELDTRNGGQGPMKPDTAYVFPDMQQPAGAVAVVTNLTANAPTAGGDLVAYPVGTTRPAVSDVNFAAGQKTPNLAILPNANPAATAQTTVYNDSAGSTNLLIDLFGYFCDN